MRDLALRLTSCRWPKVLAARHTARRGVAVIAGLTLIAKGLGFVREAVIAALFGASAMVDAYRIAEVVTGTGTSLGRQGFDVAAVPLLVERRIRSGEAGQRRALGSLLSLGLVIAVAVCGLTLLAAILLPRFSSPLGRPVTGITALMLPAVAAAILASVTGAWFNSRRQYAVPRLFDPVVNVVAVVVLLLLAGSWRVYGLAAGWSLGHIAALVLIALPLLLGGRRLLGRLSDPSVKELLHLALPALPLALIQPLNIAVGRAFAAALPPGNVALLGYADRLFAFPAGLVATSLTPVFFTKAAELSAAGRADDLNRRCAETIGRLALVLIPAGLLLVPLARPLVRLLYERGAFTAAATETTARALMFYGLGLFPYVAAALLAAALRSRKNMTGPLAAVAAGVVANCGLSALLVRNLGVPGLALAGSAGVSITAVCLWLMLGRTGRTAS
uniref:Murein biosynthesis integral membrane protein MurJ n=1 Tax=candidate division WOR-3 bacterium TaxID=2052148 RepID=A0A7C4CC61_UNCW3